MSFYREAEYQTAQSAHNMCQLGYIIWSGQTVQQLSAQIEDDHKDQCNWDALFAHFGEGGQDDHHKYHAAGAQQHRVGEKNKLYQTRYQRRGYDA